MVSLAGIKTYLSEEMALLKFYVLYSKDMGLLERVTEIRTERALSRVGKKPDGKTIEDALQLNVPKEQIVSTVDMYLQKERTSSKEQAAFYGARVAELNEKAKKAKLNGGERTQATVFGNAVDEYSRVHESYKNLLEKLNVGGLDAYIEAQKGFRPLSLSPIK